MKMLKLIAAGTIGTVLSCVAYAEEATHKYSEVKVAAATTAVMVPTEGEVRKVDKDAGKVTIRHGPLKNLDMPAMTMVFQVKDRAMLDKLKTGDKINFTAEQVNGAYTVISVEPAK